MDVLKVKTFLDRFHLLNSSEIDFIEIVCVYIKSLLRRFVENSQSLPPTSPILTSPLFVLVCLNKRHYFYDVLSRGKNTENIAKCTD